LQKSIAQPRRIKTTNLAADRELVRQPLCVNLTSEISANKIIQLHMDDTVAENPLTSVTDQTDLDVLLNTATLADRYINSQKPTNHCVSCLTHPART
jgi:hypothetical protein